MRRAFASLLSITAIAGATLVPAAQAQTPPAAEPAPAMAAPAAPPPQPMAPAAPMAPAPAPPPPTPEAPPAPPTDVVAIALLNALQTVCIPSAGGGDLAKIAKAAGYRKSGDNWVYKQPTYTFTVLAPGSNPTQCHVDIVHPIYPEAPAAPLIVALHDWAVPGHGWSLYRNDKNVEDGTEFITRSWEHAADGKNEALVLTTMRKASDAPMMKNADTSTMIYSLTK